MKKILQIIFVFLFFGNIGFAQTLLLQESFESDATNYDANTFTDGVSDYFLVYSNGATPPTGWPRDFSNIDGTYFFAAEDVDDTDNPLGLSESGYIVLKSLDVSSYSSVEVKVALAAVSNASGDPSFEQEDGIFIEFAFDSNIATAGDANVNTGTYTYVGAFHGSDGYNVTDMFEDTNFDGQGNGTGLTEAFQDFTYSFNTNGASQVSVRIKVYCTTGSEEIGVDNIRVFGLAGSSATVASVTTQVASYVTATTATGNGTVTDLGSHNPSQHGHCWSTETNPSIDDENDFKTQEGAAWETGAFTSSLTGLSANTTYYVRAYATNAGGTSYGGVESFTTGSVSSQATLLTIDFETNGSGYSVSPAESNSNASNPDYWIRTNGTTPTIYPSVAFSNQEGSYFFAAEDLDYDSGVTPHYVTCESVSIAGYSNIQVKILAAGRGDGSTKEGEEFIKIQYQYDGGGFTTVSQFIGNGNYYSVDADADGVVDGASINEAMSEFTFNLPYSGTNLQLRIYVYCGGSEEVAFDNIRIIGTLSASAPTVTTDAASSISTTSATLGGEVTADGGATVTDRGVVYSTSDATPTIAEGATKDANGTGTGTFSESIGSLSVNTTYYYNAYAINSEGTSYGIASSFTTLKQSQTITFGALASKTYGDADFAPGATASSGLTVTYSSSNTAVATIVSGKIHIVAAGTCTIYADQAGNTTYYAASQESQSLTINKATPTVSAWPTAAGITYGDDLSSATLSGGTASVAGSFAYDDNTITPNAGTYSAALTFTPTDDSNYNTVAGNIDVTVAKATPTVSAWPTAAGITYGDDLSSAILSGGTASVAGSFAYDDNTITPNAGTYSAALTFTPTDDSNFNTVAGNIDVTVSKATPTVSAWPTAAGITYGDDLSSATLSGGTASVAGSFAYDDNTITPNAGTYSAALTFTPTDDSNFNTVAGNIDVTVAKATPTVSAWPTAAGITYGDDLSSATLSGGTASVAGSFAYDDNTITPNAGTYSAALTFTPTDDSNFNTVAGNIDVTVAKATPTVSAWPTAAGITYGDDLSSATLSGGTASVAGSFAYDDDTITPDAGTYSAALTFTPTDASNYNTVAGNIDVSVNKAPTVTTQAVSSIASTTATGNGNITDLGAPDPTAYGVCWNTGGTPTTSDSKTDEGAASSTGAFTSDITSLSPNTIYYVRAYATNTAETSYGDQVSFTTLTTETTWTGAEDDDYTNPNNWTSGVPTEGHDVRIPSGTAVDFSGTVSANSVYVEAGGILTISGSLTASGDIIISSDASSSGSLIITGTYTGPDIVYERYVLSNQWHLFGSPLTGQSINSFLTNSDNAIKLDGINYSMKHYIENPEAWSVDYTAAIPGNFEPGMAYVIKRSSEGTILLIGQPNTATANKVITRGDNGWNLLGNPFTSAIAATEGTANGINNLITANVLLFDPSYASVYVWEENPSDPTNTNNYRLINHADSDLSQDYLQVGQGFFVKSAIGGGTFTITPAMQSHQTAVPFKTSTDWISITLKANISNAKASTKISYREDMSKGLDIGYDAGLLNSYPAFALYSRLVEDNGIDFGLQCLPLDFDKLIVPIGLDARDGEIVTFSAKTLNIPKDYFVVLEDRAMNVFTDLSEEGEYVVQLDNASEGTGRFFVRTSMKSALGIGDIEKGVFQVFTRVNNNQLVIRGEVTANTIARIYTITGKQITTINLEQAIEQSVSFNEERGVYIIQISNKQGTYTQKFSWVK